MSIMTRLRPNAELIISDAGEPIDQSETPELSQRELKGGVLAAAFAILSVGYALLAYGGVMLTRGDGLFAAVWMPNAIVLGVILHLNLKQPAVLFPTVFCGSLLGNWMAGFGAISAFGFSFANTGEVALAMYLLKKLGVPRPNMERMQDLGRFVLAAGLVAPSLSASIAAVLITYDGGTFALGWINWFMADAMGMVLITPPLMIIADTISGRQPIANRQTAEWVSIIVGGTVVTAAVFSQSNFPLLFLIMPVLAIAGFRLGSFGTAIATLQVGLTSTILTWQGTGPIAVMAGQSSQSLIVLQAFLATGFTMGLPIAAAVDGRKQATKRLALREAQLAMLTDNVSDAVLSYDADGIGIFASPSVREVLGEEPEVFIGKRPTDRIHPEARQMVLAAQAKLLAGQSTSERFTYRRFIDNPDGSPCYIEANCRLVQDENVGADSEINKGNGIIVSCRDVTERIDLEHKLVRARKHAENAAHAKSEFLANMSHEIRTPMNGVLGFADILLRSDLPKDVRKHVELIEESGKSMMRLLNDILDISKIEAGQVAINKEPVNVSHLLENCMTLHSANAAQKSLDLVNKANDDLPAMIVTDGMRLRQIIHNLIGNAIKFTGEGSITLHAEVDGDSFVVAIEDTGIGIEESRMQAIFDPFEQADKTTSRRFGGTGLGLAISRQLAVLLGGTLEAASMPQQGSRFQLRIPLEVPEAVPVAVAIPAREEVQRLQPMMPAPSRILLAEDHDINRILVTTMLERCGQIVETAEDGDEAIAAVLSAHERGEPFQLVLMDIQMPECDGYEATKLLRSAGISPSSLPIVALTANAFEEDVRAALASGMQAHLAKPLIFDELIGVLQRWLPTRIVESDPHCAAPVRPAKPKSDGNDIQKKWLQRRGEAIDAVRLLKEASDLDEEQLAEIARVMHKLAGTAGMFGENELGERASALERVIVSSGPKEERARLAEEILEAA